MSDNVLPSIDRVHNDEASETTAQSGSGWWLWHRSDIYMLSVGLIIYLMKHNGFSS